MTLTRATPPGTSISRRLAAVGALLVIVVGLPIALATTAGSPLPHSMPTLAALRRGLTQPLDPQTLAGVIGTAAWLAWGYVLAAVALEVASAVVRRPLPVRLPGPGQSLAHRLVTTALVAATSLPTLPASAFAATPQLVGVVGQTHPQAVLAADRHDTRTVAASAAPTNGRTHVVRPDDTLWDIAEAVYGDGQVWRAIEAANLGRPQPDGRAMRDGNDIYPGWVLILPDHPRPAATAASKARTIPEADRHPKPPNVDAPLPRPSDGAPQDDVACPPQAVPTSPTAPPPTSETTSPTAPIAAVGGSALFAACTLATLQWLRRRQRRQRQDGHRIPAPAGAVARAEVALRIAADPESVPTLGQALEALARAANADPAVAPRVAAVRLGSHAVDLILDPPPRTTAPSPFTASDDGRVWSATSATLTDDGDAGPCPLPALAPVGRDAGGVVLLNLEHAGTVSVTGAEGRAVDFVTSLAAEVAAGHWASWVDLTLVGLDPAVTRISADAGRVTVVDELNESILRTLQQHAADSREDGGSSDLLARRAGGSDIAPQIVVMRTPPDDDLTAAIQAATGPLGDTPVVIVAAGAWAEANLVINLADDGTVDVPALGLRLQPCALAGDDLHRIADLLDHARDIVTTADPSTPPFVAVVTGAAEDESHDSDASTGLASAPVVAEDADDGPVIAAVPPIQDVTQAEPSTQAHSDDLDRDLAAYLDTSDRSIVRVAGVGAPHVEAPGPLDSKRARIPTELVMLLAAHPRGLAREDISAALWPTEPASAQVVSEVISRARAWLGTDADGRRHLPPIRSGVLALSPRVLVDWNLQHRLIDRADRQPITAERDLAAVLALVRGRPFDGVPPGRYAWLAETSIEQDIIASVIDAAHRLARLYLDHDDPANARDSARIAQLVDPYDERSWRDLMEAEHALGHVEQVAVLRDNLIRLLDYEVEEDLSPETVQLLDRLLPRAPRRSTA